jgi:hypothetical protein
MEIEDRGKSARVNRKVASDLRNRFHIFAKAGWK